MNVAVVIPARFASTRLPGKPLLVVAGKPILQYVYENALRARSVSDVLVATDDSRILDAVLAFGGKAVLTSPSCASGSDRVAEVVSRGLVKADVVVNLQGDEPELSPGALDSLVSVMSDPSVMMATLAVPLDDPEALADPSQVKVVVDLKGDALYFSRAPIPVYRDALASSVFVSSPSSSSSVGEGLRPLPSVSPSSPVGEGLRSLPSVSPSSSVGEGLCPLPPVSSSPSSGLLPQEPRHCPSPPIAPQSPNDDSHVIRGVSSAVSAVPPSSFACHSHEPSSSLGRAGRFLRHLGIYAYRPEFLLRLAKLSPTPLELAEKLEQLRVLEHGYRIRVALTDCCPTGIDTPADLDLFRKKIETANRRPL